MATIAEMRSELARLEAQAKQIRDQGRVIKNPSFWFDSAQNKAKVTYYRKRWFDDTGRKRSEVVSPEKMNELKAAIARGKQLAELEREIAQVQQQLDQALAIAAQLGLSGV